MKAIWALLFGFVLLSAPFVAAQDEESGAEGGDAGAGAGDAGGDAAGDSGAEEGAGPGKLPKDAKIILPSALPPLGVKPLSVDSPTLAADDALLDSVKNDRFLNGMESVRALTNALKKASALLAKMKTDVEGEKLWAKQVYEIIQNYEMKYARTLADIKTRNQKIELLAKLVDHLKASTLQSNIQQQLDNAQKALGELVGRTGGKKSKNFSKIEKKILRLQKALAEAHPSQPGHAETTQQIQAILSSEVPPAARDALNGLVSSFVEVDAETAEEEEVIQEESEELESEEEEAFAEAARFVEDDAEEADAEEESEEEEAEVDEAEAEEEEMEEESEEEQDEDQAQW